MPGLTMLASDVSAPSLERRGGCSRARAERERANITVADGLSAVDRPVDAVMILGMGAGTILKIVAEGREKIGGAALIVQANVDLPLLRGGLAELGFAIQRRPTAARRGGTTSRCWRGRARPKCRTSGG
ncbi:MAG: tRNA (adenine(22)-N(1))-methyltransferase TrmK [Christensenellales bacterium]